MTRFAIKIDYSGKDLSGWQKQKDAPSIQGHLEAALKRITGNDVDVVGAGRTDAGVHATGQVAHLDLEKDITPFRLSEALNYHLKPLRIAVVNAAVVPDDFHARFSAVERRYLYRLLSRRAPAIIDRDWVWQVTHPLDLIVMQDGASHLIGNHDFTTFRSVHCQAQSPVKTMDEISITPLAKGDGGIEYQVRLRARSFLHNQVRSIVGTLERVGAGSWEPSDVREALEARDRAACGPVAPPDGLYLTEVIYPNPVFDSDG